VKKNKKFLLVLLIILIIAFISVLIFVITNNQSINKQINYDNNKELISSYFDNNEYEKAKEDIISIQRQTDKDIETYKKDSTITIEEPKVIINPYHISPLTAVIIFNTQESVSATIKINDEEQIFSKAYEHVLPVYGLLADYNNEVEISLSNGQTKKINIQTNPVITNLKPMTVTTNNNKNNNQFYFVTGSMGDGISAYDDKGNVRWYLTENYHNAITVLKNGHLLLSNDDSIDNYASTGGMVEIDYLGKIYNEYNITGGYHHDVIELENGNFLVDSSNPDSNRIFDYIVEIDRQTGKTIKKIDIYQMVKDIDSELVKKFTDSWAWINSVFYDKKTDSLILSLRGLNSIISIDYKNNKLNWIFGSIDNWSEKFKDYILIPADNVRLPLGQHSAFIDEDGNLGLLNNGYDAYYDNESNVECNKLKDNYSSIALYKVTNKNISLVWEYDSNKENFSYALSNYLKVNNNHLVLFGWEFAKEAYRDDYLLPNGQPCTQLNNSEIHSEIVEVDSNKNIIFKATINQGKYRVNKLSIYNDKTKEVKTTPYKILTNEEVSPYKEVDVSKIIDKLENSEQFNFSHEITKNIFTSTGLVPDNNDVSLLLVGENGKAYEYIIATKTGINKKRIYLDKLSGVYKIYIIWNNEYKDLSEIYSF